ncbi:Uncharacterized protein TCM_014851 [Theobroma cacao]|uniref:Uncharacterized protein n=1 Tax=Theobroma cacao TaxID=3641 RepID=A0A061G6X7_THECC|nr:Uncharacterized protein TCM_014851 [Theobroma cacao]
MHQHEEDGGQALSPHQRWLFISAKCFGLTWFCLHPRLSKRALGLREPTITGWSSF